MENKRLYFPLGDLVTNLDSQRVPLSSRERIKRKGIYPYYGATGIMDWIDDFLYEGLHLLIAEDGSVENAEGKPVLQLVNGRFWVSNHAHVLRCKNEQDTKFLYYFLNFIKIRPYITGSVQPKLSQQNINRIPIYFPNSQIRKSVVETLGALDDKIELNRRMNRTLEDIAQAIFKNMFVDNPEREKWKKTRLGDEFELTMGQSPPGSSYNNHKLGTPFFQGKTDFGFRYPENRIYCTEPTRFAKSGNTLVSVRAPVGAINMALEDCAIGRGVASLIHNTKSRSFTYYSIRQLQPLISKFEAEGTVFGSINKNDFENIDFFKAPVELVNSFENKVYPIDQLIESNERESKILTEIRDRYLGFFFCE